VERVFIESLKFSDMTLKFGNSPALFKRVNAEFCPGNSYWIQGHVGDGKSTLLKVLIGVLQPYAGEYRVNGQEISQMTFEEFAPYRLNMGYSFDMGGLLSNRTITENLMLPLIYHKILSYEDAKHRVHELLSAFDFLQYANERPAAIPGGARKLACILRALVLYPQVFLLDDPSAAIGVENIDKLTEWLRNYQKEHPKSILLFASQDESFAKNFSPTEYIISEGALHMASQQKAVGL
jgi:ABC-type lipoprotein export system ATPase subunit